MQNCRPWWVGWEKNNGQGQDTGVASSITTISAGASLFMGGSLALHWLEAEIVGEGTREQSGRGEGETASETWVSV